MEVSPDPTGPALSAVELYRFFHVGDHETFALRGVSLELAPGEFGAIVGPSGSGKSTLLACLAGLDDPDGGVVLIAGRRMTRRPEGERASFRASSIGMLLQSGNLLEHLTVRQNVVAAQNLATRPTAARADDLLASVGLAGRAGARPSTLSGGEAARAGLAVAMANDPPVVLADEPTAEVDAETEGVVLGLLQERAAQGTGVLVVTHSEEMASAADRVFHLADGRLVDA